MGFPVRTSGKITFGGSLSNARDEYYLTESIKASDTPDRTRFNAAVGNATFQSNTFNDRQYPTEGISSCISLNYISGTEKNTPGTTSNMPFGSQVDQNFYLLKGNYERYFKINKVFTLGWMGEGVYSNKKPFSNYVATVLAAPSFDPIPHSKTIYLNNFHANKYVASGLKGIFNLSDQLHLRTEVYGFLPIRQIAEGPDFSAIYITPQELSSIKFMASGALVFQSALGPVSLSLNYYDKSQTKFFAMLNFGYILFNKRGY